MQLGKKFLNSHAVDLPHACALAHAIDLVKLHEVHPAASPRENTIRTQSALSIIVFASAMAGPRCVLAAQTVFFEDSVARLRRLGNIQLLLQVLSRVTFLFQTRRSVHFGSFSCAQALRSPNPFDHVLQHPSRTSPICLRCIRAVRFGPVEHRCTTPQGCHCHRRCVM